MKKKLLAIACSAAVLAAAAGCGSGENPSSDVPSSPAATQSSAASQEAAAPQSPSSSQSPSPSKSPAIVEGFPEKLIPVYPGSTPTASSFAEDGKLLTASLTASSAAAPEEIAAFYTQHFAAQGFAALEGDAVDSTSTKDFARTSGAETETANVSMVIREGQTVYTVGANVLPESAE